MYLDLEYRIRTDGEFRHELNRRQRRLEELDHLSQCHSRHTHEYHQALYEYIEFCQFNLALLTSYFWPAYPREKPLYYADYPFAFQMFNYQPAGFMVFRASRQISKSTSFACRQWMMARAFRRFRSMYIVPRSDQLETYTYKFREMEEANRFCQRDTGLRQNLAYKQYENGSVIEMAYVQTSAAGIRGKSTDEILYDEYQHFDPDLELEVSQIQSASEIKSTIYAGTSLTTDTALDQRWSESSQGSWILKCPCGHWNIPLLECGALDMIQAQGPSCVKCRRLLNVREGKFVHANNALFDAGYRGFHIPQIIVPAVVYNPRRWAEIFKDKVRTGANRTFVQEVLGEATEQGEREITRKQLEAICTLGSDTQQLLLNAKTRYRWVVSGCDWGGSDHIPELHIKRSTTTVHAILGVLPNGELDILHFRRYEGMNYDDITADIVHMHKVYSGYAIASDFGVGAVYNSGLRKEIPAERHLILNYVGPASALLSEPAGQHQYNQFSLNKTESISLTFEAVRRRRIRCFDYQLAQHYLQDFLNLFRAPGERSQQSGSTGGATTFIYRSHPSKPNDALMAVNYVSAGGQNQPGVGESKPAILR